MTSLGHDHPTTTHERRRVDYEAHLNCPPIRIHTLGRFGIQIDGLALPSRELRQQKPVEFLQCLIALGGRGVNRDYLSASLWPDADGDDAANCYDVTLYRLRKLLKHDNALIACDSRLTINNGIVWVDAWSFERSLSKIESLIQASTDTAVDTHVIRILDQVVALYQGGFLAREAPKPWGLHLQERLRSKLMRGVIKIGTQAEMNRQWEVATHCYHTGLEIDPLYELFYQRLMICYRESHRTSEALAVYQRCRANLSAGLCLTPSPDTEIIRTSL